MCCSPVTSVAFNFPSLPNILKSSLDSLSSSFIFPQSIFYILFLETACCKVINNPPVAKTNERLPVQSCTVPLGCCSQLLWETLPRQLQWPPSGSLASLTTPAQSLAGSFTRSGNTAFPHGSVLGLLLFSSVHSIWLIPPGPMTSTISSMAGSHMYVTNSDFSAPSSVSYCHGIFTWLPRKHLVHDLSRIEISCPLSPSSLPFRVLVSLSVYSSQNLWGDLTSASPMHPTRNFFLDFNESTFISYSIFFKIYFTEV